MKGFTLVELLIGLIIITISIASFIVMGGYLSNAISKIYNEYFQSESYLNSKLYAEKVINLVARYAATHNDVPDLSEFNTEFATFTYEMAYEKDFYKILKISAYLSSGKEVERYVVVQK